MLPQANFKDTGRKKLALAQFDTPSPQNLIPLAAGTLVSACKASPILGISYEFEIVTLRKAPHATAEYLAENDVVGFSNYMWNMNHSLSVARSLKQIRPTIKTIFGGPSIPRSDAESTEFLRRHPFIDYLVVGEGEHSLVTLLETIETNLGRINIPGVVGRTPEKNVISFASPERIRPAVVSSPFLDGTFDLLMSRYPGQFTGALLETNRGCPFACTFCDWGQTTQSNVVDFSIDKLEAELTWIAKRHFGFLWITDANFGIRRRDLEIASLIAAKKLKYGYPITVSVSWAKNTTDRVIEIQNILIDAGIESRTTISMQSFSSNVARHIKRSNMKAAHFSNFKASFAHRGLPTYTELIFPLPGETYSSFTRSLVSQASTSPTDFTTVFLCRLLPNTELSTSETLSKFGIKSKSCRIVIGRRPYTNESVDEHEEIAIETTAMPQVDWERTYIFTYFFLALYNQRLIDVVVSFLRYELGVDVYDFFQFVVDPVQHKKYPTISAIVKIIGDVLQKILDADTTVIQHPATGPIYWEPNEAAYLEACLHKQALYNELKNLTSSYLRQSQVVYLEQQIDEVFGFQDLLVPDPDRVYPIIMKYAYAWDKFYGGLCRCDGCSLIAEKRVIEFNSDINDYEFKLNDQATYDLASFESKVRFFASQIKVNSLGRHSLCSVEGR